MKSKTRLAELFQTLNEEAEYYSDAAEAFNEAWYDAHFQCVAEADQMLKVLIDNPQTYWIEHHEIDHCGPDCSLCESLLADLSGPQVCLSGWCDSPLCARCHPDF